MPVHKGLHPDSPFRHGGIIFTGKRAEPVPASIADLAGTEAFRQAAGDGRLQDLVLARAYEQALKGLAKGKEGGDE